MRPSTLTGLMAVRERSSQQLSYGQRKRVALAGALAMRPKVLIMDEPTAGLDTQMVGELMELTDKLNEQGMTIILSTHDVDMAYNWADSVHVLDKGRLVFSGTPEGFFSRPRVVYETGLVLPTLYELNRLTMAALELPDHPHPKSSSELLAKTRDGPPWAPVGPRLRRLRRSVHGTLPLVDRRHLRPGLAVHRRQGPLEPRIPIQRPGGLPGRGPAGPRRGADARPRSDRPGQEEAGKAGEGVRPEDRGRVGLSSSRSSSGRSFPSSSPRSASWSPRPRGSRCSP